MKISTNIQDYLDFLRYSLGDEYTTLPDCARRINWQELLKFALKQSIVGIYWQGIQRMGNNLEDNKPSEDDVLDWMSKVANIERRNKKLDTVAVKVTKEFQNVGYDVCILKGQGNALLYPNPSYRTSGDIDVYIHPHKDGNSSMQNTDTEVKQIIAFCKQHDSSARAIYHHIDFPSVDNVPIEVHYRPSWLNSPINNKKLQQVFAQLLSGKDGRKLIALPYGEGEIFVPTFGFNVVFQLCHIYNHLLHEGIGLRQLIDYYYLLKSQKSSNESKSELNRIIRHCGLAHIGSALSWVLINILGLSEDLVVVTPNERFGKQMLNEMIAGGNFGKYDERKLSGVASSKVMANIHRLIRDTRMAAYYPSECLWEPWFRIWHWVWRKKHN